MSQFLPLSFRERARANTDRGGCGACQKANGSVAVNAASCSRPSKASGEVPSQPLLLVQAPLPKALSKRGAYLEDVSLPVEQQPERAEGKHKLEAAARIVLEAGSKKPFTCHRLSQSQQKPSHLTALPAGFIRSEQNYIKISRSKAADKRDVSPPPVSPVRSPKPTLTFLC